MVFDENCAIDYNYIFWEQQRHKTIENSFDHEKSDYSNHYLTSLLLFVFKTMII